MKTIEGNRKLYNQNMHSTNFLQFDNVNGFDGAKEYDHNQYLTELNKIDSGFQNECKQMFRILCWKLKCFVCQRLYNCIATK